MGYTTKFTLHVEDDSQDWEELVGKHSEYESTWIFEDEVKWYSHEEDMRSFSKLHPTILFQLSGEGEDSGDIWTEYYLNGKMQRCEAKITYDPFDETKLK